MHALNPHSRYRRAESVLVVVYVSPRQVLLLERSYPEGYWQSVTGGLEWNEQPADCARRELMEETGIDATPLDTGVVNRFEILPEWRHRYDPQVSENTEYVFRVQLEQACEIQLSPEEHIDYQWLDAETAIQRCFSHTNVEAIRSIVSAI